MHEVLALTFQSMQSDAARLERIASNMANVSTTGYKKIFSGTQSTAFDGVTRSLTPQAGEPDGVQMMQVATDQTAGSLKSTGSKLDLALTGPGYFLVQTPHDLALTRAGDFQLDARGRLVTRHNDPVLGNDGEITIGFAGSIDIDSAGKIWDRSTPGQSDRSPMAQLRLVLPERAEELLPRGHGMYAFLGSLKSVDGVQTHVRQGHLESSNVRPMEEMIQLMSTMRHFESMQKMVIGYDEMVGGAIRKLGDVA